MTGGALLEVEGLRVAFPTAHGGATAVDGVSFAADRGRTLGLVGESGAGKSVTAMAILGLTGPEATVSGRVLVDGRDLRRLPRDELRAVRGGEVGVVFQDPLNALHPLLPIGAQVVETIRAHRAIDPRDARRRAAELLDLVGLPDPERRYREYPHQLSGGMRQRAMLAIAIANDPKLLIADEPTTALDVIAQARILDLIARLRADLGMAVILITHDLAVVARAADDVAVMRGGRIVEQGPVAAVLREPSHPHTRAMLDATLGVDRPSPNRPRITTEPAEPGSEAGAPAPLLEVERLVKHFPITRGVLRSRPTGVIRAVDGVSFAVATGEMVGIVGESGSGKSTLCRSILQLVAPTSGVVRLRGRTLTGSDQRALRSLRREVQVVFQDPHASLNPRRTVGRTVGDPLRIHRIARGAELRRRVAELLERVGLSAGDRDRYPHQLSGGQQQRVAIARALASDPRLVIADEPVSSLDGPVRAQVLALLRGLQDDLGLGCILVTHDIGLVRHVADRIAVMHRGRLVEIGPAEEVCSRPTHPHTAALLAAAPTLEPGLRHRGAAWGAETPEEGEDEAPRGG